MSLPTIPSYPMPTRVPDSRADWPVDPSRAALLIHDMQRYFLDAFDVTAPPVPELIANIRALRSRCHTLGIPVLYSVQPGDQRPEHRGLLSRIWGRGLSATPEHTAIVDELAPAPQDVLLTKWRYSAFQRTDLADRLRAQGRDQLVVTGVYAHLGCLLSAADAFMQDIETFYVADAVADFTPEEHELALTYAAGRCARVVTAGDLLREMSAREAVSAGADGRG